jgi:general secretion pathway protein N
MSRAGTFRLTLTLTLTLLCAGAAFAETSGDGGGSASAPRAVAAPQASHARKGNPLWAIPLDNLRATRERPLFSASRRPPAPPVVAAAPVEAPPPPPPPSEPEKPQLALVGVVHGAAEDIGVFINQMDQSVIRLRVGQDDHGWVVRAADLRAMTLQKDSQQVKLELPARDATAPPGSEVASMAPPGVLAPAGPLVRAALRRQGSQDQH